MGFISTFTLHYTWLLVIFCTLITVYNYGFRKSLIPGFAISIASLAYVVVVATTITT